MDWLQWLFDIMVVLLVAIIGWLSTQIEQIKKHVGVIDKQVTVLDTLKIDPIEYAKLVTSLTQAVSTLTAEVANKSRSLTEMERSLRDIQDRLRHLENMVENLAKKEFV